MKIAWIGLGAMGVPMAARAAEVFPTVVWNRTGAVAADHARRFGTHAVELSATCAADVIFTCLPTTDVVSDVARQLDSHLREGTTWVDCTSGEPAKSQGLSERLAGRGVTYLDAPVSGMAHGARAGTLACMVGGDEHSFVRVRPVLETFATTITHLGPVGAGHAVKAMNNALFALSLWGAAEVLQALAAFDVQPEAALHVLNASSGRSVVTEHFIPAWVLGEDPPAPFRLGQTAKDIGIAAGAAGQAPLLHTIAELYDQIAATLSHDTDAVATFSAMQRHARQQRSTGG